MDELAHAAGLRGRQTLNEWFSGKRDVYLGSLQQLADALEVRRVDLVAAYDGVAAPAPTESEITTWLRSLDDRLRLIEGALAPVPSLAELAERAQELREIEEDLRRREDRLHAAVEGG
jgi:hypothetical protein